MEFAVLTSPLWWIARQWLRFLTGLVIIAAALGVSQPGADQAAADRPAPGAHASGGPAVTSADAASFAVAGVVVEAASSAESAPIVVATVPARVEPQWSAPVAVPASVAVPVSADVAPVGQRAPPV